MESEKGFLVGVGIALVVRFGIIRSPSDPMHLWVFVPVCLLMILIEVARRKRRSSLPYQSTVEGAITGFLFAYMLIDLAEGRLVPVPG